MSSDAKRAIVSSAREIFARRGYDGASVDAIVKSAWVSKGAFYWHFQSKFDLFRRVMEDEVERIVSHFGETPEPGLDVVDVIHANGEGLIRRLFQDGCSLPLWFELVLSAHRGVQGMVDLAEALRMRVKEDMRDRLSRARLDLADRGLEDLLCVFFDGIMFNVGIWLDLDSALGLWRRGCGALVGGADRG